MKILVTGGTGKLGKLVINELLKSISPENIAISTRNTDKARDLKEKGIDVRYGDFDKEESLSKAFEGIDKILIISTDGDNETRIRQHKTAVDAAKNSNVKLIAYTSVAKASESSLPLALVHKETESYIKQTGIPYVFLRNNWYLENEIDSLKEAISTGTWTNSIGEAKVSWSLRKDYAKAATKILVTEGQENKIYELSRKALSVKELVSLIEKIINKNIFINNIDLDSYSQILKSNQLPQGLINFIIALQSSIKDSSLDIDSNDFQELLGSELSTMEEALTEIIATI